MSGLEHAVPEKFFNDPNQCNLQGNTNPIVGLPDCPQGISAVKAIGLAAAQGQKIYTITQKVYNDNPNIVATALSAHSYDTQNRIQNALNVGYEVTIHESPITQSGWSGAGFTSIDPNTGAGAYTIEGGATGGWLDLDALGSALMVALGMLAIIAALIAFFLMLVYLLGPLIGLAISIILIWSLVLYELYALNIEQGALRSIIANLAWGAFGMAIGVISGSAIVAFISWVLGSIGNYLISKNQEKIIEYHFA